MCACLWPLSISLPPSLPLALALCMQGAEGSHAQIYRNLVAHLGDKGEKEKLQRERGQGAEKVVGKGAGASKETKDAGVARRNGLVPRKRGCNERDGGEGAETRGSQVAVGGGSPLAAGGVGAGLEGSCGGGSAGSTRSWWVSDCGHTVRLLRPKGDSISAKYVGKWLVRISGPLPPSLFMST